MKLTYILMLLMGMAAAAKGVGVDTVNWAPDSTANGAGTGTLVGGTITVNYLTFPGGNGGITINDNWNTSIATDGAVGSGATNLTAGILASTGIGPVEQRISFSAAVTNPILFVNFADATGTMSFISLSLSLLDSNNAQLAANTITFAGAGNSVDDGFAARISGTFGPGAPIEFIYSTVTTFDSVAMTVGVDQAAATATPLPGAAVMGGVGLAGVALLRKFKCATGA